MELCRRPTRPGCSSNSARKLAEPDSQIAIRLDRAVLVLDEVISDLRRNLGELRGQPSDKTLSAALQQIASDPRFLSLVDISLEMRLPDRVALPAQETDHILAIVHEALSNVIRHAHARQVKISVQEQDAHILMNIQDDGIGFRQARKEGFGLRNMKERARILGGKLDIQGQNGKGTIITLEIPTE